MSCKTGWCAHGQREKLNSFAARELHILSLFPRPLSITQINSHYTTYHAVHSCIRRFQVWAKDQLKKENNKNPTFCFLNYFSKLIHLSEVRLPETTDVLHTAGELKSASKPAAKISRGRTSARCDHMSLRDTQNWFCIYLQNSGTAIP